MLGSALGLAAGVAVGSLIYLGLSKVKPHRLFAVTNVLILLLAAAIASQLARALIQAGIVDWASVPLWDSTRLLSMDSALGAFLHALVGYDARPSGLQLLFYGGALALIIWGSRTVQ